MGLRSPGCGFDSRGGYLLAKDQMNMANKNLFASRTSTSTTNKAGGVAIALESKDKLARLALTGTMTDTFYAKPEVQLKELMDAVLGVDFEFVAKTAVYARKHGHMKDVPSILAAYLAVVRPDLFKVVAPKVVDNGRMVRNLVQVLRSKSIMGRGVPNSARRYVRGWLRERSARKLLSESVGQSPSIKDMISMFHPRPKDEEQSALFAYLCGREFDAEDAPEALKVLLKWRESGKIEDLPLVEHRLLEGTRALTGQEWGVLAQKSMGWHAVRMNLNTMERHGAFKDPEVVHQVAARLQDEEAISRARVWPTQVYAAMTFGAGLPKPILDALDIALELSLKSAPILERPTLVAVDVSGSMRTAIGKSKITAVQAASLFAGALLRQNPTKVKIVGVDTSIHDPKLRGDMTVPEMLRVMSRFGGGGTQLDLAYKLLQELPSYTDIIMFSDNESWVGSHTGRYFGGAQTTPAGKIWKAYHRKNPDARSINVDFMPYGTAQVSKEDGAHYVAGYSDSMLSLIGSVLDGSLTNLAERIEQVDLG